MSYPSKRADPDIGLRASEFIKQYAGDHGISTAHACDRIGINRQFYYNWANLYTPSAEMLRRLVMCGADANYILTGKRSGDADAKQDY